MCSKQMGLYQFMVNSDDQLLDTSKHFFTFMQIFIILTFKPAPDTDLAHCNEYFCIVAESKSKLI